MVTSNALKRTLHIGFGGQTGTGFLIDIDQRQYLVTARHVVSGISGASLIAIQHNNVWRDMAVQLVGHATGEVDISVLALPYRIADAGLTLPPDAAGLMIGRDAFFLGFPFGLFGDVGAMNNDYPMPFVKRGLVSSFAHNAQGLDKIFLDGINNPGFSGGPVVFCPAGTSEIKVASVISGYRYDDQPVFDGNQALPLSTRHNTGIVISYGIGYAVSLALQNPIGPQ